MDLLLQGLAERQRGLFTTFQARGAGLDDDALSALVRHGGARHLARGLYALPVRSIQSPVDVFTERACGGLLLYPDAALSHEAALVAHGLPVAHVPARPRLIRPLHRQVRTDAFVIDPRGTLSVIETQLGPAVHASVAIMQVARSRGVTAGVVAADAALHAGVVTIVELDEEVGRVRGWPASHRAQMTRDLADGRTESVGESRTRIACTIGGIGLVPQVTIVDRNGIFVARVDFLVKGTRVVLEFDGRVKYASGDGEVLFQEKRREDALRRLGYVVVRIIWADLRDPARLLARIRAAIELDRSAA